MLGTSYFIGYVLTLLWLPRLADVYGRRPLFTVGMALQWVLFTVIMVTKNFWVMLTTIFLFGMLASIRQVTGWVYFMELLPKKNNTVAACVFCVIDALTYLMVTVYFLAISKDWFYIILFAYILQVLGAGLCWFLPESPVYLLSRKKIPETLAVFTRMAKVNKREDQLKEKEAELVAGLEAACYSIGKDETTTAHDETPSTLWFLKQKNIALNLSIMVVVWLVSSFDYYLIMYLVNTFEKVYLCAIVSSLSELVAYAVSGGLYEGIGVKASLAGSFAVALIGGLIILSYGLDHQSDWTFVLLVLFAKFGIACSMNLVYVSHCATFPTLFAATAFGYCNFLARLFCSLSPLISTMEEPLPMWFFTITAGLAAVLSLGLKVN